MPGIRVQYFLLPVISAVCRGQRSLRTDGGNSMPKSKDVSEKILEDTDIVNGLVFNGREVIHEDELETIMPVSQLKMDDGLHEQERDVAKRWKRGSIILAVLGLENQSAPEKEIPLRIVSYDGTSYKDQVNRRHSAMRRGEDVVPFYPSITIVLYFGSTHWSGPRNLRSCFDNLPKELEPFIPDYPVHVIEVAFLSPEQIGKLKSDFRYVADYLVQTRTNGKYVPTDGQIVHVDETLKLLGAITGDDRFQESMNTLTGRRQVTMSDVIDSYIAQGREEARKEYEAVLAEKDRAMKAVLAEKDRAMKKMAEELRELKLRYGQA